MAKTRMTIDMSKQYRTRDGREVRILMTDGGDWHFPVIAAYKDNDGRWWPTHATANGKVSMNAASESPLDLIEVKPRIKGKVWVNVYPNQMGVPHSNKAYVDAHRRKDCIACVEIDIDVEEGHGL